MKTLLAAALALLLTLPIRAADGDVPQLGRGINLGNFLESPKEGMWTGGHLLQESDFTHIKEAGFAFIRVPIRWSEHVTVTPGKTLDSMDLVQIDPAFFQRVDWVVAQAEKNGLTAILDYHNDDALMKNPDAERSRFEATWLEIAEHYKDAPASVLFELLNEPNGKLDAPHWNAILVDTLTGIRHFDPTRTVVVGPVQWNSIDKLKDLVLPDSDQHLLVTVHYYNPMHFTHQGAEWIWHNQTQYVGTKWLGTDAEKKAISDDFDKATAWGRANHRPMYLGEFGAFEKGDMDSRARWIACVARTAESDGMSWSYWEYDQGFGAFDPVAQQWRQPLLKALLP